MIIYIMNQWKLKKNILLLMVIGFLIANLFLSIGVSISVDNYNYIMDQNSGDLSNQLILEIDYDESVDCKSMKEVFRCLGEYGEVQVISLNNVISTDNNIEFQPVAVEGTKIKGWHIPLTQGQYLRNKTKEIVIGKDIANNLNKNVGDDLSIDGVKYIIIGITGRNNRETAWDNTIYLNIDDYFETYYNELFVGASKNTIFAILKTGKQNFIRDFEKIEKNLKDKNVSCNYEVASKEIEDSSFSNSIWITIVGSGLIFVVAIINIVNLMIYWMLERRKDLAIMKALGCVNNYLFKWIIIEMVSIAFIGAIAAVAFQYIIKAMFLSFLNSNGVNIEISLINILMTLFISMICGVVTALAISGKSLKFSPSEVMSY